MERKTAQILVVEDVKSSRKQLVALLKREGFETLEAANGEEAVEQFSQHHPDLILMDIHMPIMDGYEATRQIKERAGMAYVPIIFVSAESNDEAMAQALESGGDDFVTKPINVALLRAKVNVQLRIRTLNNSLQSNIQQMEREIADQRKTQQELMEISNYDQLTGLPNRHFFLVYLGQSIKRAEEEKCRMGLMMLDIARFKRVNDVHGHLAGDQVLKEATRRLEACGGNGVMVARMGGDHFALFYEDIDSEDELSRLAEEVIEEVSAPYSVDGKEVMLGLNIGIALYPSHCDSTESILRCAGTALEFARQIGNNHYCFFESEMQERTEAHHELNNSIHTAQERGEFELYYQPQVDAINRQIVGCEALLRWNHPKLGLISPDLFIPMLEKEQLITQAGEWVMREAIRQHLQWLENGLPGVRIAVNFSAMQLQESGLADKVIDVIRDSGIAPPWFKLEITETATIGNVEQVAQTLHKIRESGIQIAVDDFGTGYSSLNYLQRLPVDIIKIDRQFVKDIPFSTEDMTLVKAVIAMAHNMGLDVVAEGVETEEQAAFLRKHMCEELQGYLFSRPLPADEFEQLLSTQSEVIVQELTMFSADWGANRQADE